MIPEYFKENIGRLFGDKGRAWLERAPEIVEVCIKKWQLSDLKPAGSLSVNLILLCKSELYGDVVLKIGVPHEEYFTELETLGLQGDAYIKCFANDESLNAMILERVIPGEDLDFVADLYEQLEIAAEVISRSSKELSGEYSFPTYQMWCAKAFKRVREENKVPPRFLIHVGIAEKITEEIKAMGRADVLLHGDLHHENMLRSLNDQWKIIDPKGVIGPAFQDSARFIQNHILRIDTDEVEQLLDRCVTVFAEKFNESKRVIAMSVYLLKVLTIAWMYEDEEQDEAFLKYMMGKLELLHDYLMGLNN